MSILPENRSTALRYGGAVVVTVLAAALRLALDPLLGERVPFMTFFAAVIFAAWYGGPGPSAVCALLSTLTAAYLFMSPHGTLQIHGLSNWAAVALFVLVSGVIALLAELMRAAQRNATGQSNRLRTTLHSIGDAVIATDLDGRVTSLNPVAEQLTGWTSSEAAGQPLEEVFRISNELTGKPAESPVAKVLRDGVVVGLANHTILTARDGSSRPIDDSAAPIRDERGQLSGVVLVFRDVTEARRAEETRRHLAAIVEASDDAIISKTLDSIILSWNAGAERLFGYTAEEAIGQSIELIIPPELRHEEPAILERLRRGERIDHFETVRVARDGRRIDISLTISPVRDAAGRIVAASKVARDITERRRADAVLRKTEARTAAVVGSALDGIVTIDHRGTIVEFNPAAEQIFGWKRADVVGRELAGVIIPAELRDRHRRGLTHYLQTGHGPILRQRLVMTALRSDGTEFPVELAIARLGTDEPPLFTGYVRDMTEQKRTEQALRASEEQARRHLAELQTIYASAPIGLAFVDRDLRYVSMNEVLARLNGHTADQVKGRRLREVLPPAIADLVEPLYRRVIETGEPVRHFEVRGSLRTDGGEPRDFLVNYHPVNAADGTVLGVNAAVLDITDRKRAEQKLAQMAEDLRLVTDAVPALISYVDANGCYQFNNKGYAEWFGVETEAIRGKHLREVLGEAAFDRVRPHMEAALAGQRLTFESELPYRSGGTRHVHADYVPDIRADGSVAGYYALVTDISEQKRAEAEARFQAQMLDTVAQAAIATRPDGTIIYWNQYAQALFGWSRSEALGRNIIDTVLTPEAAEQAASIMDRLRAGETFSGEFTVRRRDGTSFPAFVVDTPVFDDEGRLQAIIGISTDITERKQVEQALRFLADASSALAALTDYESTLQRVAGLAVPAFADWCTIDIAEPDGALRRLAVVHADPARVQLARQLHEHHPASPEADHGAARVLRTGEPELIEDIPDSMLAAAARDEEHLRTLRQLGLRSFLCVPLRVRGAISGAISFVAAESGRRYTTRDLAFAEELARRAAIAIENASLYQEVRDADRRKDEFLAMLAHELRNPLAPIRSGLDVLTLSGVEHRVIDLMREQVQHLVRLVDDLLDVSRIMRGKAQLRKEPVDLAAAAQRAAESVRDLIDSQRHELHVQVPETPVWIEADAVRLAQIITNLLNNAAKYTEPGGRIEVAVRQADGQAVLSVRDTGIGISPDLLPRVFELFAQADQSLERSQGGLGIGLTLVRSLVELHGGTVSAQSAGPGQGSEFTVRLPVTASATAGAGSPGEPPSGAPPRRSVLVVDDNVTAARMLELLLNNLGCDDVQLAHDGATALAAAGRKQPEIILLDIGLPHTSGYDVARELRSRPEYNGTLLVALTGYGTEEDRRRSLAAGFDEHRVKPLSVDDLRQLLAHPKLPRG